LSASVNQYPGHVPAGTPQAAMVAHNLVQERIAVKTAAVAAMPAF
jgi:hypothetical protein